MTTPIHHLTRLRTKHGAASPIGSRCSCAIETLQNLEKPELVGRAVLMRRSLKATLTEITELQAGQMNQARREVAYRNQQRGEV